jgi:hypothetical protein
MKSYFKVKNWDDFQHYKDRNPPWIKLHNHLLDDYDFECLGDAAKGHLLCIWMLASRTKNSMPFDVNWISKKIGSSSKVNLKALIESGFLVMEHDASTLLQGSEQDATPSVPSVEESRGETEKSRDRVEKNVRFTPPTHDEAFNYFSEKGLADKNESDKFVDFYEMKGWAVGRNKMKDWKAAVRNWMKNCKPAQQQSDNWDDPNWHKDLGM